MFTLYRIAFRDAEKNYPVRYERQHPPRGGSGYERGGDARRLT